MRSKLRRIHINRLEWCYVIDGSEIRIYEPNTKQIKVRVNLSKLERIEDDFGYYQYPPSSVKRYIKDNLL
jgi:hypothetical protein